MNLFTLHMDSRKKIINGALLLGGGAFIAKILGAIYRVPLTNLLGGEGLGLYQMVFPVYCVLLDFSGAGVPNALSKIIAEYRAPDKERYAGRILKNSIKFFALFGGLFTLLTMVFAKYLSAWQGNGNAFLGYLFLAPAIILVSLISCYRGYFQGLMNMKHTAISQILEQVVKLIAGLLLIKAFLPNVPLAVGGATLGVAISEAFALIYLYAVYKRRNRILSLNFPKEESNFLIDLKKVIYYTVPIMLIGIFVPLSQIADSFLIVNLLSEYRKDATVLYGLFSGAANTVINLPVSVCYGLSVVAVPFISGAKDKAEKLKNQKFTLRFTFFSSFIFALCVYFFSNFAVGVLFGGLGETEKAITVKLIKLLSVNVLFLSLLQTQNSVLIGLGKAYLPLIGAGVGLAVRIILCVILLKVPELNIYAGGISSIACYFTAVLINFIILKTKRGAYATKMP